MMYPLVTKDFRAIRAFVYFHFFFFYMRAGHPALLYQTMCNSLPVSFFFKAFSKLGIPCTKDIHATCLCLSVFFFYMRARHLALRYQPCATHVPFSFLLLYLLGLQTNPGQHTLHAVSCSLFFFVCLLVCKQGSRCEQGGREGGQRSSVTYSRQCWLSPIQYLF